MEKNSIAQIESAIEEIRKLQFDTWFFRFSALVLGCLTITSLQSVLLSFICIIGFVLGLTGIRQSKAEVGNWDARILELLPQINEETNESELSFTARRYILYLKKNDAQSRKPRSAMLQAS